MYSWFDPLPTGLILIQLVLIRFQLVLTGSLPGGVIQRCNVYRSISYMYMVWMLSSQCHTVGVLPDHQGSILCTLLVGCLKAPLRSYLTLIKEICQRFLIQSWFLLSIPRQAVYICHWQSYCIASVQFDPAWSGLNHLDPVWSGLIPIQLVWM